MEPNAFVAEVYRRMSLRHASETPKPTFAEVVNDPRATLAMAEYQSLLPRQKDAAILDVGFGAGWFLAACVRLGYTNLAGADFGIAHKRHVRDWSNPPIALHPIESDIGDFLVTQPSKYDFIHLSHVIEHIPKYSLLWIVDALFQALKPDGTLILRTPNMEGPAANSCYYVSLAHEYGFCGSNLRSLLDICGFDDVRFIDLPVLSNTRQRVGRFLRWPYQLESRVRHRLFGVNSGGKFAAELVVTARRGNHPPLLNPKCR